MIPARGLLLVVFVLPVFAASSRTVAPDGEGNVWTVGQLLTVPFTANAFQKSQAATFCFTQQLSPFDPPTSIECPHAFVMKQDNSGKILYATYLGGSSADFATAVTTDSAGNAYVTGSTYSPDFPVTGGVFQPHFAGPAKIKVIMPFPSPFGPREVIPGGDAFVVKFAPDGTVVYSTLLGGGDSEIPTLIGADASGSAYIAGTTASTDFPITAAGPTPGATPLSFFAKLSPDGSALAWSSLFASTIQDFDVDARGVAWLAGSTTGPVVTKIDTAAGRFLFSRNLTNLDPKLTGSVAAIVIVPSGNVLVGVSPRPTLTPPYTSPQSVYPLGPSFLAAFTADGSSMASEIAVDRAQFDQLLSDASGNTLALGHGAGALPATPVAPQLAAPCATSGGEFAIALDSAGNVTAASYLRQGGVPAAIGGTAHLAVWRAASQQFIPLDLTMPPGTNFECLMNLASGVVGPGIAPGEIFTVSGNNIGPAQAAVGTPDASGLYPTTLGGARVLVNGTPAPLLFAQAGEIHGVVPFGYSPPVAVVQVQYQGRNAPPLDEPTFYNPGIFNVNGSGAVLNQDGTVNSPSNPAARSSVVSIYATGLGALSNPLPDGSITPIPPPLITVSPPQVTFAGVNGDVLFAGAAPALIAGVDQINARVPATLPAGTNLAAVPVMVIPSGVLSPPVTISVAP